MIGKIKSVAILILILFTVFSAYSLWSGKKVNSALSADILDVVNKNSTLQVELNEKQEELASVNSLALEQSKELSKQASEIDRLETLSSQTRVTTQTVFQEVKIPVIDTIVVVNTDTVYTRLASYSDKWLSFNARVFPNELKIDSISIINKFTLEVGFEKQGVFKKPVPRAYLLNKNPYTRINEITSIQFIEVTPWYNKNGYWLALGVVGGFILKNQLE